MVSLLNNLCKSDRKDATDVKETAVVVKEALQSAKQAQTSVSEALKHATANIRGTQSLLVSVSMHVRLHLVMNELVFLKEFYKWMKHVWNVTQCM